MPKKQNQTQATQAKPDFRKNPPSTSSKEGGVVQIIRPARVSILAVEVYLKDKEPKVHIEHFFDIDSLENAGYVIKEHLMLCNIYYFFEDPKVVVLKLIHEF